MNKLKLSEILIPNAPEGRAAGLLHLTLSASAGTKKEEKDGGGTKRQRSGWQKIFP